MEQRYIARAKQKDGSEIEFRGTMAEISAWIEEMKLDENVDSDDYYVDKEEAK